MATQHRPTLDTNNVPDAEGRDRNLRKDRRPMPGAGEEERGIDRSIADADKQARTGATDETVRDTPPFGDYYEPPFVERNKPPRDDKH
jgi:hypothetical protein